MEDLQVKSRHEQEIKVSGTYPEQLWRLPQLPVGPARMRYDLCRVFHHNLTILVLKTKHKQTVSYTDSETS